MASLDGYSLNEKINTLHEQVQGEIRQLEEDFQHLYNMLKKMETNTKKELKNVRKQSPKSKTK